MKNLSCENEFYLHDNKKSFSQERFCTWPRFKKEACGISEMTYSFSAPKSGHCKAGFHCTLYFHKKFKNFEDFLCTTC